MARAPNAALHSVKRFLGQPLAEAQKELDMLPFEVEEKNGKVVFKVRPSPLNSNSSQVGSLIP